MTPEIQKIVDGSFGQEELHKVVKPIVPIAHTEPEQMISGTSIAEGTNKIAQGIFGGLSSVANGVT